LQSGGNPLGISTLYFPFYLNHPDLIISICYFTIKGGMEVKEVHVNKKPTKWELLSTAMQVATLLFHYSERDRKRILAKAEDILRLGG
jgi:hypothetical protein